jgi:ubiquitin-like protein ATG12
MAPMAGSPESHSRALPAAWTSLEPNMQEALDALESYKKKDPSKGVSALPAPASLHLKRNCNGIVVVRFKAVGNAPIMKQNLYKITASNRFQAVIQFLRKELGWKAGDPLVRPQSSLAIAMNSAYHFHVVHLH